MTEQRRSLTDSLKATPTVSPEVAREFIHAGTLKSYQANPPSATRPASAVQPRTNYSTRLRTDFVASLKRASLERQLNGIEPHTMVEILEQALEPWLRANGYMD